MTTTGRDERARFESFYGRKWSNGSVLWEERYPVDQGAYAVSVYRRRNEAIIAALPSELGVVLDVGCGVGDVARLLASRATAVLATDLSFVNAVSTRENLQGTRVGAAQATVERLPLADGSVDVVVLADVIEHVPDPRAALEEIRRVLRPCGVLVCATPIRGTLNFWRVADWLVRAVVRPSTVGKLRFTNEAVYEHFLTIAELRQMLVDAGFHDLRARRVCFYPAPETAGTFGAAMRRYSVRRGPRATRRAVTFAIAVFDLASRARIGNQKQLWVVHA